MTDVFTFDEYVVRRVEERDRDYLSDLIANDPHHRDCMDADFFLKLLPGEDAWAVETRQGRVLLYFKTQTAVRLALQFADSSKRLENLKVLTEGMAWMEGVLDQNHFREILFDTTGPALKAMAIRRLGFVERSELVKGINGSKKLCRRLGGTLAP